MHLQLAELREVGRAGDLGRAAAGLGRRRRASWGRAPRRGSARRGASRRRSAGGSGRGSSRGRAAPV
jgi:hypothetical protein